MIRLEEGKVYSFRSLKTVDLPGGKTNLMLLGPDNLKYLLPLEYYEKYDLKQGSVIRCKVDKINCSGKVFLEPEHPYYIEGGSYAFTIGSYSSVCDEKGRHGEIANVYDSYGNTAVIPVVMLPERPGPGSGVSLQIERISKGKIYFRAKSEIDDISNLEEGVTYEFRIDSVVQNPEGEDFYLVFDPFGREHLLKVRYYVHYGLVPGNTFKGRIIRYGTGKNKSIEPENPWFKPGDILEVTLTGCAALETGEGYLAEAFDNNGFKHTIQLDKISSSQYIRCTVVKIKKGKPVLAICR